MLGTQGKQRHNGFHSWSPKRATTCFVDRISSHLASVHWLYLPAGVSAPTVNRHCVFPLVFEAQTVNKLNRHNFGFLLTLSDLKEEGLLIRVMRFAESTTTMKWQTAKTGQHLLTRNTFFFPKPSASNNHLNVTTEVSFSLRRLLSALDLRSYLQNYLLLYRAYEAVFDPQPIRITYPLGTPHGLVSQDFSWMTSNLRRIPTLKCYVRPSLEKGGPVQVLSAGTYFPRCSWTTQLMRYTSVFKEWYGLCILQLAHRHAAINLHNQPFSYLWV